MSRVRPARRTAGALVLALACAAALWAFAGGGGPTDEPTGGPTGAPPRAAGTAAAPASDAAVAPATAPPAAPLVPGSTLVGSQADGTQVLDGIPCQVRQPDGTMSPRSVRITIQPAAAVPVENSAVENGAVENTATAPGHR